MGLASSAGAREGHVRAVGVGGGCGEVGAEVGSMPGRVVGFEAQLDRVGGELLAADPEVDDDRAGLLSVLDASG